MKKMLIGFVMMLFISVIAIGQTTQVTGKVTDANGMALPNASIRVKGARGGVSSTINGTFTITVKAGATLGLLHKTQSPYDFRLYNLVHPNIDVFPYFLSDCYANECKG